MAHLKSEALVKIPEPFNQEILSILDKNPRGLLLGGGLRKPHLPIFGAFTVGPFVRLLLFRVNSGVLNQNISLPFETATNPGAIGILQQVGEV